MGLLIGVAFIVLVALGLKRQPAGAPALEPQAATLPTPPAVEPLPVAPTLPTPRTDPPEPETTIAAESPVVLPTPSPIEPMPVVTPVIEPVQQAPPPDPATLVSPGGGLSASLNQGGSHDLAYASWSAKLAGDATDWVFADFIVTVNGRSYGATAVRLNPGGGSRISATMGTGKLPGGAHDLVFSLRAKGSGSYIIVAKTNLTVALPIVPYEGWPQSQVSLFICGNLRRGHMTYSQALAGWTSWYTWKNRRDPANSAQGAMYICSTEGGWTESWELFVLNSPEKNPGGRIALQDGKFVALY